MMEEPDFSELCDMEYMLSYLTLFPSLYDLILQAVVNSSDLKQDCSLFLMFLVLVEIEGTWTSIIWNNSTI